MENHLSELEDLLTLQDNYLKRLIELGLRLENNGNHEQAFSVYKTGLNKTENVKSAISGAMIGLLD